MMGDLKFYFHGIDAPTVKLHKMCEDIDKWLVESLPRLEIENYLYRKV